MNATIRVENVSDSFLKALKILFKTQENMKFKIKKDENSGYPKWLEDEILEETKNIKKAYKKGKLKTFSTAKSMHEDISNG